MDGGHHPNMQSPFRLPNGGGGSEDFPNNHSFDRAPGIQPQRMNNSMMAAIYQQRPGGANKRSKKSTSITATAGNGYSVYQQKFAGNSKPTLQYKQGGGASGGPILK